MLRKFSASRLDAKLAGPVRKSKFNEQQIAFILRQADEGTTVEEVCREARISIQTNYRCDASTAG